MGWEAESGTMRANLGPVGRLHGGGMAEACRRAVSVRSLPLSITTAVEKSPLTNVCATPDRG